MLAVRENSEVVIIYPDGYSGNKLDIKELPTYFHCIDIDIEECINLSNLYHISLTRNQASFH